MRVVKFFNFVLRNLKQKLDNNIAIIVICDFQLTHLHNRIYSRGRNT